VLPRAGDGQGVQSTSQHHPRHRRTLPRKSSRRRTSTPIRRSR
jgi:hypothetical protein